MSPTIVHDDAAVRAATWGGVFFDVWKGAARPAHLRDLATLQLAYAKEQPDGKIAHVGLVRLSDLTTFDAELRRALEERSRAVLPKLRATVIVMPTTGFAASMLRGIITGVTLIHRAKVPVKVGPSHEEPLAWLAPQLPPVGGRQITAAELTAAYMRIVD